MKFTNIGGVGHFLVFGPQSSVHVMKPVTFQANGKYRQQGRNYVVEDGDIILFKFNAGAGLSGGKKK